MPIGAELQKLSTSPMVELFALERYDPDHIDEVFRFTPWRDCNWLGHSWAHLDCKTSGFQANGRELPKPKIQIANIQNTIGSLAARYEDLLGATLWRYRTLETYLHAGSSELLQAEKWTVQQKTRHDNLAIEWELSILNLENTTIPRRAYRSNYGQCQYRDPDTCGYTGPPVADVNDNPTFSMAADDCGRKIGSCRLRFGNSTELPIDIYPGVSNSG